MLATLPKKKSRIDDSDPTTDQSKQESARYSHQEISVKDRLDRAESTELNK